MQGLLVEVVEMLGLEFHPFVSHEPRRPGIAAGSSHNHDAAGPEHFVDMVKKLARILDMFDNVGKHADVEIVLFRQAIDISTYDPAAGSESLASAGACVLGIFDAGHVVTEIDGGRK